MSDIIIRQPELLLLIPVIGDEIEKILFKVKRRMIGMSEIVYPAGTRFVIEKVITQDSKQHFIIKIKED